MRNLTLVLAVTMAPTLLAQKHIRVNQVGYLPDAPKFAVVCALDRDPVTGFRVLDGRGRRVNVSETMQRTGPFGPCLETYRLNFSQVRGAGTYTLEIAGADPVQVRVGA